MLQNTFQLTKQVITIYMLWWIYKSSALSDEMEVYVIHMTVAHNLERI